MAVSLRSGAASAVRPARRVSVKCQAGAQKALPAAVATFAAASLIATPAFAGVILEQPELKKVFQADSTPAAAKPAAATPEIAKSLPTLKSKAAPAPKAEAPKAESGITEGGFNGGLLVLPAAVAGVAGLALAASKLDDGFEEFMAGSLIKDSSVEGAGYEVALKVGGVATLKKTGTKKFFKK